MLIVRGVIFLAVVVMTAVGLASAKAEILIGTAGPMTGQYAWFGEQHARGAEMTVDDINATGGVLGREVRRDDAGLRAVGCSRAHILA